jgi:hypothetical protein
VVLLAGLSITIPLVAQHPGEAWFVTLSELPDRVGFGVMTIVSPLWGLPAAVHAVVAAAAADIVMGVPPLPTETTVSPMGIHPSLSEINKPASPVPAGGLVPDVMATDVLLVLTVPVYVVEVTAGFTVYDTTHPVPAVAGVHPDTFPSATLKNT